MEEVKSSQSCDAETIREQLLQNLGVAHYLASSAWDKTVGGRAWIYIPTSDLRKLAFALSEVESILSAALERNQED